VDGNELEFKKKEDVRVKCKAISIAPDNSKIEIEVGDPDGEERTLTYYDMSKPDLEKIAKQDVERMRFDGYRGSVGTFNEPCIEMGDVIDLGDPQFPEKDGKFWTDKVRKEFGVNGGKRTATLGPKAN
jgi:hypothetical protein